MDNFEEVLELERKHREAITKYEIKKAAYENKQRSIALMCNIIAIQTQSLVMAAMCGVEDDQ